MQKIKYSILITILFLISINSALATGWITNWINDNVSNSTDSPIKWDMVNADIDSKNDFWLYDKNTGNVNAYSRIPFKFDTTSNVTYFMWRIYRNDYSNNFGYIGIGRVGAANTNYNYKLYLYANAKTIYFEGNTSMYFDNLGTSIYEAKNYQDWLMIFYANETGNNTIQISYKNLTAYNDPININGFSTIWNITLNGSWGGSWGQADDYFIRFSSQSVNANESFNLLHVMTSYNTTALFIKNMTINDSITREILNVSSITFNGNTYRTTNGTFQIDFATLSAANQIYNNVIVDSSDFGGYNTAVYNGVNFSSGAYTEFNLSSINVHFLVFDPFNVSLQPYEVSYNTTNKSTPFSTGLSLNLTHRYDTYNFQISTNGHSFRTTPYTKNFGSNYSGSEWITLLPVYCHQYATDSFSGDGLNTFSVNALGTTWFTNNGTCTMALENWNECNDIKNNVVVDSPENGGYFTKVFNGLNINNYNFPMENVRIQMIGSNALDQTTIPSISCLVNATTITSDGTTCYLNFSQGIASLSISSLGGYNTSTDIFATIGNTTYYRNVTLAKTMNFLIRREYDQTCFPFNTNMNMSMVVYCSGASQQFNITQCDHNFTIGCSFDSIVLAHNNITFNYFRTLIPAYNDSLVTWYMLDLNQDTGVQVIINLLDLSGQYNTGTIRLKRYFGTSQAEIIEQHFDLENSVNLYLLRYARYSVEVCNQVGMCVSLGELIGDVAEEKTLTIPNLAFYPTNSLLGNNITWSINWTANNRISMNYNDTTHATTMIEYLIYNGSNTGILYYNNTIMTYDLYATYIIPVAYYNTSFLACFRAYQPSLGIIKDCRSFYEAAEPFGYWEGFTAGEIYKVRWWGSLIFLFVIMFLFSPYSIKAGLVLTNIMFWLFIQFRWLLTSSSSADYTILFITSVLSVIFIIGMETRSGGQVAA